MTLLPILARELRQRSRGRATYWARFGVGLLGFLICLPETFFVGRFGMGSASGDRVFSGVITSAFLLSCSACLLAADSISAERREGTLGLLFLTKVKSLDVLFGKLSSVGIASVCALVAFFPVLVVPVIAGGITLHEAFRSGAALFATLTFALATGLFASAAQRERSRSVRSAVLLVSLFVFVPFGLSRALPGGWSYVGSVSPLLAVVSARETAYVTRPGLYWASLLTVSALAAGYLVAAALRLRRAMREGDSQPQLRPLVAAEEAQAVGLYRWEPSKDEASPIEWLVYRQQGVNAGMWVSAVVALAYSGMVLWAHQPFAPQGLAGSWLLAWPLGLAAALLGGGIVAGVASRFLMGVRRTGDLELLLTTPVGAQSLVSDQWNALKRLFTRTVPLLQAGMFLPVLGVVASTPGFSWNLVHTFGALLSLAGACLSTAALCWLALWFALRARSQAGAVVWSVGLAKGLPCLVSVFCWALVATMAGGPLGGPAAAFNPLAWVAEFALLAFYVTLIRFAQRRLAEELSGIEFRPALLRLGEVPPVVPA
jgi:ABC-type transport system involved in multi-copper enzyme maturation permease subunit